MIIEKITPILERSFRALDNLGIQSDQAGSAVFVLLCLNESNFEGLSLFDEERANRKSLLMYKDLELKGLIEISNTDAISLTAIGQNFIDSILYEFPQETSSVDSKFKSFTETDSWINEYLKLWPSKSSQGYYLKGDVKSIKTKMNTFIKEYGYTKEEITEATKQYLEERAEEDFNYIRKVSNFISFREATNRLITSDLAAWCERVREEGVRPEVVKEEFRGFDDYI